MTTTTQPTAPEAPARQDQSTVDLAQVDLSDPS